MAISNICSSSAQPQKFHSLLNQLLIFFLLSLPCASSTFFNFSSFQPNLANITLQGDAFMNTVLQLTKNEPDGPINDSVGRATFAEPVRLWDASTGRLTDFTTHFSFSINALNKSMYGDGLAFFIAPVGSDIPQNSSGGYLGLFSPESTFNTSSNQIVAVEFDSFQNPWDPNDNHVGINVNSIVSAANVTWKSSIRNGSIANAWVSYNSITHNLSVFLTYANNPTFDGYSSLWYVVDLRNVLPEWVSVGFSAATGQWIELHTIRSWSFNSTLD